MTVATPETELQVIVSLIAIGLYVSGSVLILTHLKKLASGIDSDKSLILLAWGGAIPFHALVLYQHMVTPRGLNLEFFNALSMVAILIVGLLFLSTLKRPLENLGIIVLPIAAVSITLNQFVPTEAVIAVSAQSYLQIHILVSLLAYSVLSLAAFQAILLAIQDHHLHSHHPGGLIRALPPLRVMEQLLFQLIGLGFVLLSLALLSGFFFLEDIFAQHQVHKTTLSITAWLVFAVLLLGRWRYGWRGRTATRWMLMGFVVLMLAYFGSKLVLELVLERT